jgi:hypothetical integral membrane protein (TIGR02206 family)
MKPWTPFGADHLAALGAIALASVASVLAARRGARGLRVALAAGLLALLAGEVFLAWRGGWLTWMTLLPLQICDLAVLLAAWALLARDRRAVALLYFWAFTGTLLAAVMPDLLWGFPSLDYFVFFGLHGLVVAATALLVFGLGLVPGPRAWLGAWLFTLAYAALAAAVNLALGTNFLYLCRKPDVPTLLDFFGPWPLYIAAVAAFALGLFRLLDLPLARARSGFTAE